MPLILDGKTLGQQIRAEVRTDVSRLRSQGIAPRLQVVLVGDDPASALYVRSKEHACAEVGIETDTARLPAHTSTAELLALIADWNRDATVHGILVQLPLPEPIDTEAVLAAISPTKDVDGLHPFNLGRIISGSPFFFPATPSGILELLTRNGIMVAGKHVVIVGRGELVGKPLANMLIRKEPTGNATVTVCHRQTSGLDNFTRQADILVAAAGSPELVKPAMVKPGVAVIDVGTNRIMTENGSRLVGDVDFAGVAPLASAISPVPGGVGPMTVAMLLVNTVKAAKRRQT